MEAKDYVLELKKQKLTQVQIAGMTGIHQSTISKIETGVLNDVSSKSYRALQTAYQKVMAEKQAEPT